jgi:hypothetical protein
MLRSDAPSVELSLMLGTAGDEEGDIVEDARRDGAHRGADVPLLIAMSPSFSIVWWNATTAS